MTSNERSRSSLPASVLIFLYCLMTLVLGVSICSNRLRQVAEASSARRGMVASSQNGKSSPDGIWQEIASASRGRETNRNDATQAPSSVPAEARTIWLDKAALSRVLERAPMEFTEQGNSAPALISLPMPDGQFARFSIVESPIMAPELAAEYPQIRTYRGQGIDDPTATTRFDWTPAGFHAMVLSEQKTVFVDPVVGDIETYRSLTKDELPRPNFTDRVVEDARSSSKESASVQDNAIKPAVTNGTKLRIYRMALAATFEYTQAAGGTTAAALARMTTSMNRINGIFEREVAVRMVLIANEDKIIYTTNQQPYTNNDANVQLNQNQTNLDNVIGSANYDIGHVFSTASGGVGQLFAVCRDGSKARGASGSRNPTGDSFDVDLASQEIDHQFSARHTFNGTSAGCGGGNRDEAAAYEPGSGSTIGAYTGICGDQNLQRSSDDYFHVKNLEEMVAFINGDGNCAQQVDIGTGNTPPNVNAGANFTIPKNTPFTLTATGNDADPGDNDRLTFAWEEYDKGPASPPDNDSDGQARPIFRTYQPTKSPSRTFPRLDRILANPAQPPTTYNCAPAGFTPQNCQTGEVLPSIARTMNFQVTARDTRGGISSATMQLTVDGNSGPFLVTGPAAGSAFPPASNLNVTWNVANTNTAPVNATNAKISLSMDGGQTFPTVLADNAPNNGTAAVTLPNVTVAKARIKVEAVGNIFFSISPEFSIRPACVAMNIAPDVLPNATVLVAGFNQPIMATGGTGVITLAVTAGALPSGVELANGALNGAPAPQDVGTFNFTITATDANGCISNKAYMLNVVPQADIGDAGAGPGGGGGVRPAAGPTLVFPVTLSAPSDKPITIHFDTKDGTAVSGKNYQPASGTLTFPPGVTMQTITVTAMGVNQGNDVDDFFVDLSAPVNVNIGDGEGDGSIVEDSASGCPNITLSPASLPSGKQLTPYDQTFTASGGAQIAEFVIDAGSIPPGLSLNKTTGRLSGTPTALGTFNFTVAFIDTNDCFGVRSYSLAIDKAQPAINTAPLASDGIIITKENTPISGRLTAVDSDVDSLTFSLVPMQDQAAGTVVINNPSTGDFTYTPQTDFAGADEFLFSVSDGKATSNTAKVTVIVTSGQSPIVAGLATTNFGTPLAGATITLNGSKQRTTITDVDGFYSFDKVDSGPQTVTPVLANYTFNPGTRSITVSGDRADVAFVGTRNPNGTANTIDTTEFFVRQNYLDFLNREPDQSGFDFWTNNIRSCTPQPSCNEVQRINTSAAYFLSIEFQQTGYLAERFYKVAFGDANGTSTVGGVHQLAVPIVRFEEFDADLDLLRAGLIVGQTGWETVLENNKQAYAQTFVGGSRFASTYPTTLSPSQFVDQLFAKAGFVPSAADRNASIGEFGGAANTSDSGARARALRRVVENAAFINQEFNRAFVLIQYFGYLRRDPNVFPDRDYSGFDFWLQKLNQFGGNYLNAEMIKAFIGSSEYRKRFGP